MTNLNKKFWALINNEWAEKIKINKTHIIIDDSELLRRRHQLQCLLGQNN